MSISQGFQALQQGQVDAALRFFQNESDDDSRVNIGVAQALLHQKNFAQAMTRIQRAHQQHNQDADLLLAQTLGSQGKRDEAIRNLMASIPKNPNQTPLIYAFLAEQKMRQGYWDESAGLFIEALSSNDPRALVHLQHVMHDITNALAAKRIRAKEVVDFLATLQQALTPQQLPPQLVQLFHRSIKQSAPLPGLQPIAPLISPTDAPARQPTAPLPSPARPNRRVQHPPMAPNHRASTPQPPQATRSDPPPARRPQPAQAAPAHAPLSEYNTPFARTEFGDSMREQRRLNRLIQGDLEALPPASWPSDLKRQIDDVVLDIPNHLTVSERVMDQLENDEFSITHGNIFTQIHLEECLSAMMQSIPYEVAHTLSFQPRTLNRLEINLLDGWLDDVPQIPSDPLREIEDGDVASLALGTFIGETLARTYNAVWRFSAQPKASTLQLGKHTIDPMRSAMEWMNSNTKEDVRLDHAERRAKHLLPASHTLPSQIEYIDPTFGLSGPTLLTRLAELWSFYFFKLVRVPYSEIIPDLQELWQNQDMIVLRVHKKWCPRLTPAMQKRGSSKRDGLIMAYKRQTGEFFFLSSRAQFSQALSGITSELNDDTSRLILRMLSQYHAPNATVIADEHMASQWAAKTSARVFAPTLQAQGQATQLIFWMIEDNQPQCWAIQYDQQTWSFLPVRI